MNLIYNYTCHALVDSTIKSLKLSSYLFDRCKTALIRFFKVYFRSKSVFRYTYINLRLVIMPPNL